MIPQLLWTVATISTQVHVGEQRKHASTSAGRNLHNFALIPPSHFHVSRSCRVASVTELFSVSGLATRQTSTDQSRAYGLKYVTDRVTTASVYA
ncbi:unnamed protein product [Protopolystoma xenopodis]|uniref:Uncharacterized protein n=1 Tax=Protopolystoma xenopodis TaxID=117903 RepID=A0A448X3Q6_9PLAT|nr:unnamed protein product [Protopolystoma xenopodis]